MVKSGSRLLLCNRSSKGRLYFSLEIIYEFEKSYGLFWSLNRVARANKSLLSKRFAMAINLMLILILL